MTEPVSVNQQKVELDQRAAKLDQREAELDQRAAKLDKREAELDKRVAKLDQREAELAQLKTTVTKERTILHQLQSFVKEEIDDLRAVQESQSKREYWLNLDSAKCERAQMAAECTCKPKKKAKRKKNARPSAHAPGQSNDTKRQAALAECMENVTKAATTVAADKDALEAETATLEAETTALEAQKAALKADKAALEDQQAMVTMQLACLAEWRLELEETAAFQTRCAETMATLRQLLDDNDVCSR